MNSESTEQSSRARQALWVGLVVLMGAIAAFFILRSDPAKPAGEEEHGGAGHGEEEAGEAGHDEAGEAGGHDEAGETPRGAHGGRLFSASDYGLELTIFEQGVDPQFRAYVYRDGKPVDPDLAGLTVTLKRLGRQPETFEFAAEGEYLKGNGVVEEPHSFAADLAVRLGGQLHSFSFEQVEARVTMTGAQLESNGVQVATAGPARIATTLQLIGEIGLNQDRTVHVVPRLEGVVESVAVNAGDRVRKGQTLAVISSRALADHRSGLLAAQKRLELARSTLEREHKLWQDKISAEQDYLVARQALQEAEINEQAASQKLASLGSGLSTSGDLTRYSIRAPIDGVVTEKNISAGEAVAENTAIFMVSDLATVWVETTVYAKDLNTIKTGQPATVRATAFDAEAQGTIAYLGSLVGTETRAAKARIVLPNPEGLWRPGLAVEVTVVAGEFEVPVAVSADALQALRDWTVVFGRYGNFFEARPVTVGRTDGKWVEVLSGLLAGERYAATNSYLIKADIGKSAASHDH